MELAASGEEFRLISLTRPIHFHEYRRWLESKGKDDEFVGEHLKLLSPQALEKKDPRWRLPLARETYLIIRSQKDLEQALVARSGFGLTVRRLNTYQLISWLESVLNHRTIDPDTFNQQAVEATKRLVELVATDGWIDIRPGGVGVADQNGREVWWGSGQLTMCPSSIGLGELVQYIGNCGYDVLMDARPLDPIGEAHQLTVDKVTEETRILASRYRRRADAPFEVMTTFVFRADKPEGLEQRYNLLAKELRSRFGVGCRRHTGSDATRAFQTFQPTLTAKVLAPPMKVTAKDLAPALQSVGKMKVPVPEAACLHLGQDMVNQMPVFCPIENAGGPINIGIFGQTGKGKTVVARYLFWQLWALGYQDLVVVDFKGQGDWGAFVTSVTSGARLVAVNPDKDPEAADKITSLDDKPAVIVVESTAGSEGAETMAKVLAEIWIRLRRGKRRSVVFFDESWVAFEQEGNRAGEVMKHFAKQGRGAGISSVFITQDPLDVTSAKSGAGRVGEQVIAQCPIQILGGLSAVGLDLLKQWGVAQKLLERIPALEVGQFVVNGLSGGKEVQLWLTPRLLGRICPPMR